MSPVFRHGRLRLYLLKLLDEAPRHGYEVIRLLQDRFMGVYAPSPGTIYPRLARLEEEGLVTHDEADGRKVYRITDKGREELRARLDDLTELEEEITASVRDIAREVTEDVRETVRTLREELTWAAREFHRASGGADPGGGLRHASTDEARARAEAARFREAARAKDAAEPETGQTKDAAEPGTARAKDAAAPETAQTKDAAEPGTAQTKDAAEAETAQAEEAEQAEGGTQASEGAGAGEVPRDLEDVPGGREDVPGGREDVPGGEASRGGEQAGAGAWRSAEDEWRGWHERWHSEAGEHADHGHGGAGHSGPGHGGSWHGGGQGHGGRGGKEWGEWAGWTGWGGWPGAAHDWADPEAYRDLERLAKQFSRDLRSAAWQAQAVSEDALRDLRGILDETIDRIKTEIFKGKTPPHQPSDSEDNPPPAS
jgi:DNA-binding PadR family transcriptional regulator